MLKDPQLGDIVIYRASKDDAKFHNKGHRAFLPAVVVKVLLAGPSSHLDLHVFQDAQIPITLVQNVGFGNGIGEYSGRGYALDPDLGEIVFYKPHAEDTRFNAGQHPVLPAIVVKLWDNVVNLQVLHTVDLHVLQDAQTAITFMPFVKQGIEVGQWTPKI